LFPASLVALDAHRPHAGSIVVARDLQSVPFASKQSTARRASVRRARSSITLAPMLARTSICIAFAALIMIAL